MRRTQDAETRGGRHPAPVRAHRITWALPGALVLALLGITIGGIAIGPAGAQPSEPVAQETPSTPGGWAAVGASSRMVSTRQPTMTPLRAPAPERTATPSGDYRASLTEDLAGETGLPPLYEGLGAITYPVTTTNARAQAYFDQGLRWYHGANGPAAVRSFAAAETLDPACALCAWGQALALGGMAGQPMDPQAVKPAFSAMARARALAAGADGRERALITALATRYSPDPRADRAPLDAAYAESMTALARLYPEDDEILLLAADAMLIPQTGLAQAGGDPGSSRATWEQALWYENGAAQGRTGEALALVQAVMDRNPEHIGALRLVVALRAAGPEPQRAEGMARQLQALAPASGHLLHVPARLYYEMGLYREALDTSLAAVRADEAYLERSGARGAYRGTVYPQHLRTLLISAQMLGDRVLALSTARSLASLLSTRTVSAAPWSRPLAAAPVLALAQLGDPQTVLAVTPPADGDPFIAVHWRYARGRARLVQGDTTAARSEADAIAAAALDPRLDALAAEGIPAPAIAELAEASLRGRIAWFAQDYETAAAHFQSALDQEKRLPRAGLPYWYAPVDQAHGAMLLEAGQMDEAAQAFERALQQTPASPWSLYGLFLARDRQGLRAEAERARQRFEGLWTGGEPPRLRTL